MVNRKERVLVSWSSGKDCAYALHELMACPEVEVVGLLTTVEEGRNRVPFHGASTLFVEQQAAQCGLPLFALSLPAKCTDQVYKEEMGRALEVAREMRVDAVAFGDIFLRDIRKFREKILSDHGLRPIFPLWSGDTRTLADSIVGSGISATITSVDLEFLPESALGRCYDASFLAELPDGVDPCGENGEFHTVVTGAPFFKSRLPLVTSKHLTLGSICYVAVDLDEALQA